VALVVGGPPAAADATFTGSVDAAHNRLRFYPVALTARSTLTAELRWTSPSAHLALALWRRNEDGSWTWVSSSRTNPARMATTLDAGTWRLGVRALSGATSFTLSEATTPVEVPPPAPPFVTILFSRSEMSVADNCTENTTGVVPTDLVVAPELVRRGYAATGSVETGVTTDATRACLHYSQTLAGSWADLAMLRDVYGWSFVSHSRNYRTDLATLPPEDKQSETCGSLDDLKAHGHTRGDGLFAYPANRSYSPELQSSYVSTCFAFGRRFGGGVTLRSAATAPPYVQSTVSINGGRCHDPALPCPTLSTAVAYTSPDVLAAKAVALGQDQWLTLQWYILVDGAREGYWDCTSPDWRAHWAMDAERYCYADFLRVLDAIPPTAVVTDPLTVAQAWGRTGYAR
jgi:hypothetical protein